VRHACTPCASKKDHLDTLVACDIGIVTRRDLEKVARSDLRFLSALDHPNHKPAREALAGVMHWAAAISTQGLTVIAMRP